jgi:serine/threonine-protein kinase
VVDFGIAKGLADADLTEIGAGLGTVGYLSPEQASGLMATPASDVYSAASVASRC